MEDDSVPEDGTWLDDDDDGDDEFAPPLRQPARLSKPNRSSSSRLRVKAATKSHVPSRPAIVGIATGGVVGIAALIGVAELCRGDDSDDTPDGGSTTGTVASADSAPVGAAPTRNSGRAITDHECLAFATQLETAALEGNVEEFGRLINLSASIDKCMAGIEVSRAFREGFRQGVVQAGPGLTHEIISLLQGGGSYHYLRTIESNGSSRFSSVCTARKVESPIIASI